MAGRARSTATACGFALIALLLAGCPRKRGIEEALHASLAASDVAWRDRGTGGFDPVDAGSLDESWRQQPGTPAYCRDLEAPALRRALAEAEPGRVAEYRAEQEARIRAALRERERAQAR